MPRVSVIIPAYNAEAFLPGDTRVRRGADALRLGSRRRRTTRHSDRTAEIAELRGVRFRLVRSQVNEGPAGARNRALQRASGDLVAFWTPTTCFKPTYLGRMVSSYDASSTQGAEVGIVACDALVLGPDGYSARTYRELNDVRGEVTLDAMVVRNPIHAGALTSRALVEGTGRFCEELFGTEDYDLWLRIVESGHVDVVVLEPLYVCRLQSGSV